jgi:hypothetical protein
MNTCRYMVSRECTNRLALPQYGARPSPGVCDECEHRNGFRGAGDVFAWLLSWTPARRLQLAQCKPCKDRQQAMNEAMPMGGGGCGCAPKSTDERKEG